MRGLVVVLLAMALHAARARLVPRSERENTEECQSRYLRFSPNHVMCKQNTGACHLMVTGLADNDKEAILAAHNRYRNQIALGNTSGLPPASDMLEMEWDDELAVVAQAHANLCTTDFADMVSMNIEKFPFVGARSYLTRTDSENMNRYWDRYTRDLYEEAKNISRPSPDAQVTTTADIGRLYHLASAQTWRVGCGFAKYLSQRRGRGLEKLYTCAYAPGNHTRPTEVYKIGQPCSQCPEGTCCGSSCRRYGFSPPFEGLCKVIREGPGPAIDEDNLLWTCQFNRDTQRGCRTQSEPADAFETKTFFATGYAEAVLQAGQSAEMTFEQIIRPTSGSLCAIVDYSKGPDVAGQRDRGLFNLLVTPVERPEQQRTINLPGNSKVALRKWVHLTVNAPVQIGFSFVVPGGSPSQYLKIRSVTIYDKACSL